ncbi:MAG: SAM-dependent chlorinase/fluorinase [archaeon]
MASSPTRPLITITCDFGIVSQGVGVMQAVAYGINPDANVVHFTPEVPAFDIRAGARVMEGLATIQVGFHVCVVDPGVGTKRQAIIIETGRGDFLVGPDNGVLIPATGFLGGIKTIVSAENEKYMKTPMSDVFHGRDIFTPAAAWLSTGVPIKDFGPELKVTDLVPAPYGEATVTDGRIDAMIIYANNYGSSFLNIKADQLQKAGFSQGDELILSINNKRIKIPLLRTFGQVPVGDPLLFPDDYGRVEIAINQGDAKKTYGINIGDDVILEKA